MNTSSLISKMTFYNNSTTTNIESWFIPFDIMGIICTTLVIGLATFSLSIIIFDKTCHTTSMMLIANSCLTEFILGSSILSMIVFTIQNDLKQIEYQDSFCLFRSYLSYSSCALQNYSYLLQGIYRYITVIYSTRLFWQSMRNQMLLISLTWIFSFLCPFPFLFTGEIIYDINNQICQLPLRFSFSIIFVALCIYVIPVLLIIFIYFKLVRYVHGMNRRITPVNTLFRAKRELKMVRRLVILVMILFTTGFPYALFIFMSFFDSIPKYHFRIAYIIINVSLAFVKITSFLFTDPLKSSVKKILNGRPNIVVARVA